MTPVRSVETTAPSTLTCGLAKSFDVQETPSAGMAQSAPSATGLQAAVEERKP